MKSEKLLVVLSALLFGIPLILILFFIRSGFDITDEALYVMGFTYPEDIRIFCTFFHRIGASLLFFGSPGIVAFRVLRLILSLISAGIFSWGVLLFLKNHPECKFRIPPWSFILFMLTGALHNFSLFPVTLSYNSMAPVFMLAGSGFFLPALLPDIHKWKKWVLVFCTGLCCTALLFIKITSGLALLIILLFIALYFVQSGLSLTSNVKTVTEFLLPAILGASVFLFLLFGNLSSIFNALHQYYNCLNTTQGYDIETLARIYSDDILGISSFLMSKWYVFSPVVLSFLLSRNQEKNYTWFRRLFLFFLGILVVDILMGRYFQAGHGFTRDIYKPFLLLILGLGGFLMSGTRQNLIAGKNSKALLVCLVLLLFPFVGASGTNIFISVQAMNYSVFIFPFLFVAEHWIWSSQKHSGQLALVPVLVGILVSAQIYSGVVMHPYRQAADLRTATVHTVDLPREKNMWIHPATYQATDSLNRILTRNHFSANDKYVFTGFSEMGFTYLLGGITPGIAPLNLKNPKAIVKVLLRVEPRKLKSMIFLVDTSEISQEMKHELLRVGIQFPESYEYLSSVSYYSYRDFRTKKLDVYIPKNRMSETP